MPNLEVTKSIRVIDKSVSRWVIFHLWFNTYRKLFLLCTSLNLTAMISAELGHFSYAIHNSGAMVLGNLLFAVLVRNELFLRLLYTMAIYGLRSLVGSSKVTFGSNLNFTTYWRPSLWMRAISSCLLLLMQVGSWFILKTIHMIRKRGMQHSSVIATGAITSTLICISVLSAFPWLRNNHHNTFERYHRFVGWLGIAMTWVFVILSNLNDINRRKGQSGVSIILGGQELWFAFFITILVALPWATLREVSVQVELPSPRLAIIRFNRGMQQGLVGRISRTAVKEFHAFGIISEGIESPYHYMVCGVQGDFTERILSHPPTTLWTRELKFTGIGHASAMYKRGIRICTGTGIGAALSTCIQSPDWFLIWIGSDQEKAFGVTICDLIQKHIDPKRMILWDTKKEGRRPDTMQLLKETWVRFEAEVVFITSNRKGNDEIMQGCYTANIPAFGTLWDF
ncbi:hypothetical protein LB506_012391 [Fusarium annulatum]|nr:hypothetical protein LB506_012391 [Fusarium annulatum]